MRTIEPCCSSAIHHAWRLHSRLQLGRKCRLEKVALVVRRSEAAGWRWSSSTLNECKPRFLGVAVMHWARPMAAELRDSRSGRRQGSSSDWRVPYGRLHTLARAKRSNPATLISFSELPLASEIWPHFGRPSSRTCSTGELSGAATRQEVLLAVAVAVETSEKAAVDASRSFLKPASERTRRPSLALPLASEVIL